MAKVNIANLLTLATSSKNGLMSSKDFSKLGKEPEIIDLNFAHDLKLNMGEAGKWLNMNQYLAIRTDGILLIPALKNYQLLGGKYKLRIWFSTNTGNVANTSELDNRYSYPFTITAIGYNSIETTADTLDIFGYAIRKLDKKVGYYQIRYSITNNTFQMRSISTMDIPD